MWGQNQYFDSFCTIGPRGITITPVVFSYPILGDKNVAMIGLKEVFYLMTHLTHFILQLYGIGHIMVKDHSDSERGNPLPPHRLLFPISSKGSFICTTTTDKIAHTTAFVTLAVEHWLEREIAQWVHHEGSIRRSIAP